MDDDEPPPPERLGPFTCVADASFFLRALGEALRFPSMVVVDVDSSHPVHPPAPPPRLGHAMGVAFGGRGSEILLEQVLLRAPLGLSSEG